MNSYLRKNDREIIYNKTQTEVYLVSEIKKGIPITKLGLIFPKRRTRKHDLIVLKKWAELIQKLDEE